MDLNYQLKGEGPLYLICLHGLGGSLKDFDFLIDHLKENYQILRVDLRGFGASDKPLSPLYDTKLWATDLKQLLGSLQIEKAVVMGHSMGARVATEFAALFPEKTLGLIALNITVWGANLPAKDKLVRLADRIASKGMEAAQIMIPPFSDARIKKRVEDSIKSCEPAAFALALKSVAQDYGTKRSSLFYEKIVCPCLILLGDRDTAPLQGGARFEREPYSRLLWFDPRLWALFTFRKTASRCSYDT